MSILSRALLILALFATTSLARSDGIYNPAANSIGSFEGIDSNAASGVTTGKILLADAASFILKVDAASKVCLAGGC